MPSYAMSRTFANVLALLCMLLALGLCIPQGRSDDVDSSSYSCEAIKNTRVKPDSSCLCPGKRNMKRQDGTECRKSAKREDNEISARLGKCSDGVCVLNKVTQGCEEKGAPKIQPGSKPPFGCVFFCNTTAGLFGFFPVGTPCEHRVNGTYYVNGTCQQEKDKRICVEGVSLPPAC
uniref:Putative secreted protein n=1 Tax=Amblyomma cajennense TaxID=34607 RepID=A0A023FC32_AMBCJ